ncbi:MAG: radical SAM protein [Bacilli bacterium]
MPKRENIYNKYEERKLEKDYIKYLEIHLADHCNLNCKGCCHFSPIASKKFPNINKFEKDIKRLSELIHGKLKRLIFMGGEPLLNKDIEKYLLLSKKHFPNTDVQILTNGLLLPTMSDSFWTTCKSLDIQIDITKYPVNFNYDVIIKKIKKLGLNYFLYDDGISIGKKFDKYVFDEEGKQNKEDNFYNNCVMAVDCAYFVDGRIYPCQLAHNIKIYNKYFSKSFKQSKKDYIDIYKVKDEKEIYQFLTKPIPFCRYCDFIRKDKIEWGMHVKGNNDWSD